LAKIRQLRKTLHRSQQNLATVNQHHPWLAMELEPNRKLFPDHLPSIRHPSFMVRWWVLVQRGHKIWENVFLISFLKKSKNNLQKEFIQAFGGWGGKRGMGLF
jgi:hypothetical protein